MNISKYLIAKYSTILSSDDKKILKKGSKYIKENPDIILYDLAKKLYSSPSSLHRLFKKVGFKGYTDFKYAIRTESSQDKAFILKDDYLRNVLDDIKITYRLNEEKLNRVADEIIKHDDLYCYGTGWKQAQIAGNFSKDLLYYNLFFKTLRNLDDLRTASKKFNKNSLLIIISFSGSISNYKKIIKDIENKDTTIIAITLNNDNLLTKIANYSLTYEYTSLSARHPHWSSISLNYLITQLIYQISNIQ